uniref:Uncharacterized protein n=1 Tax=Anguilla anguilla TaxID=7936 RepID=A0A0E9SGK3_ANGAN
MQPATLKREEVGAFLTRTGVKPNLPTHLYRSGCGCVCFSHNDMTSMCNE